MQRLFVCLFVSKIPRSIYLFVCQQLCVMLAKLLKMLLMDLCKICKQVGLWLRTIRMIIFGSDPELMSVCSLMVDI